MEPATTGFETLLRYQETLFLVLLAMLTIAACLMTSVCLLLLWFERPPARQRPASVPSRRYEERRGDSGGGPAEVGAAAGAGQVLHAVGEG